MLNNSHSWQIYIDDCFCDNIYGGEAKKYDINENSHTLCVKFSDPHIARVDKVEIAEGSDSCVFHVSLGTIFIDGTFKSCIKIKRL